MKVSTVATESNEIFKDHKLTIGLDLDDRSRHYCSLKGAGEQYRFSTVPYIGAAVLQQANRLSGQLRVQVCGVPVLPAFGEAPIFDAHD